MKLLRQHLEVAMLALYFPSRTLKSISNFFTPVARQLLIELLRADFLAGTLAK